MTLLDLRFHVNLAPTLANKFSCFSSRDTLKPYTRISQEKPYNWSFSESSIYFELLQVQIPYWYRSRKKYLSISFSHDWNPANKRFASVELRWNSVRPVKRIMWKPSPWSSLYSFRLDGNAGAFAASTHSSKEVSLNSWDLKNQGKCKYKAAFKQNIKHCHAIYWKAISSNKSRGIWSFQNMYNSTISIELPCKDLTPFFYSTK
jgi:hypothetical protein